MFATRNRLMLALAAGVLLPSALYAQQSTGSLSGRVTTADGQSGKAGVKILVIEKSNNLQRGAVTDSEGHWRIAALPVGDYKIVMSHGQETHTSSRVVALGVDAIVRFKWPAETGATVTVVETSAAAELVNTTSAEIGVNVDSTALMDMPVLDRNVNTAAVLAPGVQIIQGAQVDPTKKNSSYIVSGGGQGRGTSFNVDGADNNSSDVGGAALNIPFDAIDQFQVVTNQYKAEFGRSNAGFMNVVTKSGGNEFAGAANAQYTNQDMRARHTDEGTKLANDQEIYSATVTGPIIKDHLFFMVSAEKTSSSTGQTFDPRAVAAFPDLGNAAAKVQKDNLYVKLDWNVSSSWLASFTLARYYDINNNEALGMPQSVAYYSSPSCLGASTDTINKYGAKVTGNFGNVVWESNMNYFNYVNQIRPQTYGQTGGFDTIVEANPYTVTSSNDVWANGIDANSYQNTGVKRMEWKNEVTWVLGEHSLKGGYDWQQTSYPVETDFWPYPTPWLMYLDPNVANNISTAFSPTITAANVQQVQIFSPVINPATTFHTYGAYLQDDWTVNPNWTVFYGARLDWDTQLDMYQGLNPIYAALSAANPDLAGIGSSAPQTKKYFSPRLQVLYKPFGDDKLTFKFGYGKFTASTIDNVVGFSRGLFGNVNGVTPGVYVSGLGANQTPMNASGNPLQVTNQAGVTTNVVLPAALTPYNLANNTNGLATLFQQTLASQLGPATVNTGGRSLLASNFTYPTSQTLTFAVAYKFSDNAAIDVTALYSKTKNNTAQYTADGSNPQVTDPQGDVIFMSNQTATNRELQFKYNWHSGPMTVIATLDASYNTSSSGGSAGSFSGNNTPDFYGQGAIYPFQSNPERRAQGSQPLAGSFSWAYKWENGANLSVLGQWHDGKWYDIYQGYSNDPAAAAGGYTTLANPNLPIGYRVGSWNLDMGVRFSWDFKLGKTEVLQPFLQVQNILNNYDYGTSYYNQANVSNGAGGYVPNPMLGVRTPLFQTNSPRTAAVGLRFVF